MLIYTIPPAMRNHASVVIESQLLSCIGDPSAVEDAYLADDANHLEGDLFRYIISQFSRSLDSLLTERLLNVDMEVHDHLFESQVRNGLRAQWHSMKDFFKGMEGDPDLPIHMTLQSAYDESYDALVDVDEWLLQLDGVILAEANKALVDMEDLMALVDSSMPQLTTYAEQYKIIYASFSNGLIIFK